MQVHQEILKDESNYLSWALQIRQVMATNQLSHVLTETELSTARAESFAVENETAMSYLLDSLSDSLLEQVVDLKYASQVWSLLRDKYHHLAIQKNLVRLQSMEQRPSESPVQDEKARPRPLSPDPVPLSHILPLHSKEPELRRGMKVMAVIIAMLVVYVILLELSLLGRWKGVIHMILSLPLPWGWLWMFAERIAFHLLFSCLAAVFRGFRNRQKRFRGTW